MLPFTNPIEPGQRVLCGVRLSHLTDETTSPQRQRAEMLVDNVTSEAGAVMWAEDLDISADRFSPFKRPGLGPWLTKHQDQFDVLMFARADRAVRSMMDMYELAQWAIAHRKVIIFVKGPGESPRMVLDFRRGALDPITMLLVSVFAFAGEIEVRNVSSRVRGSQALARTEGRYHGGTPPFGYKVVKHPSGKGYVLAPDEHSIAVLNQIIQWCRAGESLNAISSYLNQRGVLTPQDYFRQSRSKPLKGSSWAPTTLGDMLGSKALLGLSVDKKDQINYGDDGLPIQKGDPVVSREDWEFLQVYLKQRSRVPHRTRNTSPLLGVVFCLKCGRAAYRVVTGTGEYYRCETLVKKSGLCGGRAFWGKDVSEVVESLLLEHIGDLEILEEVFIPGESHSEALKDSQAAWDDLQDKSAGKPEAVKALYTKKIAALEERIAYLSSLPEAPSRIELRSTGRTYRQVWESSDLQGRRRLLLDAGVRLEAAVADGEWVSVGRFERADRYDEVFLARVHGRIQYAYWLPRDLVVRATRQTAK